jgi:hypothetical protein
MCPESISVKLFGTDRCVHLYLEYYGQEKYEWTTFGWTGPILHICYGLCLASQIRLPEIFSRVFLEQPHILLIEYQVK